LQAIHHSEATQTEYRIAEDHSPQFFPASRFVAKYDVNLVIEHAPVIHVQIPRNRLALTIARLPLTIGGFCRVDYPHSQGPEASNEIRERMFSRPTAGDDHTYIDKGFKRYRKISGVLEQDGLLAKGRGINPVQYAIEVQEEQTHASPMVDN
jgi:hypothetical protein